jgi:DNA repair protein RecO
MHLSKIDLSCLGIVVRTQVFSDKDIIISILTETAGKVSAIAKGARGNSRGAFVIPDLIDLGTFELKKSKGELYTVKHFFPKSSYKNIRKNISKFVCANNWIEAIEHLTLDAHQDSHELFEVTLAVLQEIDQSNDLRSTCRILCAGLETALLKSGFGSEGLDYPAGMKKLKLLTRNIENVSGRELKSASAVRELIEKNLNGS